MSIAYHMQLMQDRATHALKNLNPKPEAEMFPCGICGGDGAIVAQVRYVRINASQPITNRAGSQLTGIDIQPCPQCNGTGVDGAALAADIQRADSMQLAQEQAS